MKHRVFVYGTLRRGYYNHELLKSSEYLGDYHTGLGYTKIQGPGFPFLVKDPDGEGCLGEVYNVTSLTLEMLDRLESHPDFYVRSLITVDGMEGKTKVYAYLMPVERLEEV